MRFLLDRGYDVTPVNPALAGQTLRGRTVVATLAEAAHYKWWTSSAPPPTSRH